MTVAGDEATGEEDGAEAEGTASKQNPGRQRKRWRLMVWAVGERLGPRKPET